MGTVTINGTGPYTVYGEHTGAGSLTEYANASLALYATFAAATSDDQKRALRDATLILERQLWNGTKTVTGQSLQWPRTGVTRADGTAVDSATIPAEVISACYELALAGLVDSSLFTGITTEDKIKRVEAKGVEVEWFGPREGSRWPGRVGELVGQFLLGAGASTLGDSHVSDSVDGESQFDDCDGYHVSGGG